MIAPVVEIFIIERTSRDELISCVFAGPNNEFAGPAVEALQALEEENVSSGNLLSYTMLVVADPSVVATSYVAPPVQTILL